MKITSIKLRDFRNYPALELTPHPGINLLFGQNGSGKTNLLEAIHYCALGRSHRTGQDREVVRRGAEMGAAGVTVEKLNGRHEVAVRLVPNGQRRKQAFVDRKKAARLSEMMGVVQCVIFSPEDLMLVKETPAVRRRFTDMTASQLSPGYFVALQKYQKALEQRNAVLHDAKYNRVPADPVLLDAFEQTMAECSGLLIRSRRELLGRMNELAAVRYRDISGRDAETFTMTYADCLNGDTGDEEQRCLDRWRMLRQEDIRRGTTTFGIHREDIGLYLTGREMKQFASQGQVRTAALAMKLAELDLMREKAGEDPILLLDDVMSELDMNRRTRLLRSLGSVQTFVTCTDESDLDGCGDKRTYHVAMSAEGNGGVRETAEGERVDAPPEDEEPDFS